MVPVDQIKGLSDAGQHPQSQNIDLQDAQRIDIILIPADDGAVLHRGVFNRHQFVQTALGDDKAADMLGQMARKALDFLDQLQGDAQAPVSGVEPDFREPLRHHRALGPKPPDLAGHGGKRIFGQAHHAPHLAHRALAPIMDHRRAQPRAVTPIAFIDELDHLFAALMFEIDVNIGRLVAGLRDETLEHHGADFGRNRGDPQRIADNRIGRRAAPLTQDPPIPRETHDVMHGQKIGLVFQLGDQGEFVIDLGRNLVRHAVGIAPMQPVLGQLQQPLAGGLTLADLRRIFIAQLVQREIQPLKNLM